MCDGVTYDSPHDDVTAWRWRRGKYVAATCCDSINDFFMHSFCKQARLRLCVCSSRRRRIRVIFIIAATRCVPPSRNDLFPAADSTFFNSAHNEKQNMHFFRTHWTAIFFQPVYDFFRTRHVGTEWQSNGSWNKISVLISQFLIIFLDFRKKYEIFFQILILDFCVAIFFIFDFFELMVIFGIAGE